MSVFLAIAAAFYSGPAVQADEAADQYAVAAAFYAQKNWEIAADEFAAFLERYPRHAKAADCIYYLGESFLQCKKLDEAQTQFDLYLSEHPTGKFQLVAAFRSGETAYLAADYPRAKKLLADFQRKYPKDKLNAYVLSYLGYIALAENDADAAAAFRDCLRQFPHGQMQDDCRLGLARALSVQGKDEEACALFEAVAAKAVAGKPAGRLADEAHFRLGAMLYKMKRFQEAIQPLEAYLAARPAPSRQENQENAEEEQNVIRVLGQLAVCHLHAGNFEAAKKCHARLMDYHLGHELLAPTIAEMAEDAFRLGETVWAARLFEWLAENGGSERYEIIGLGGLAWSRLENNQNGLACSTFERLLQKKIDPALAAEAAFARGRILEGMERCDGALAMYDRVIAGPASSPRRPEAMLNAARLRIRLSQNAAATEIYERLANDYPAATNMDTVLYEWSWALRDPHKQEKSTALLERIHREYPQSRFWADSAYRLAAAAFDDGDYQRSSELVDGIINAANTQPVLAYALRLKWQIAAVREDWPEVGRTAAKLLKECPQSDLRPAAEYWLAESTYRRGEYLAAAKLFDDLAQRTADLDESWTAMVSLRRAQIFVQQKQWDRAMSTASKISARFPNFEQQYEVDYLLGRCRASRAEFEEARRMYERVIRSPQGEKTETAAMAQWMIGETYFHQKDFRSALKAYHRVEILYDYPKWQSAALLQAAKCQRLLGRPDEADKLCRRLMEKYPDSPFVEEAARRINKTR